MLELILVFQMTCQAGTPSRGSDFGLCPGLHHPIDVNVGKEFVKQTATE